MLKNLFDVSLGGLLWWLIGYGFANGGGNPFIGTDSVAGTGSPFATAGLIDHGTGAGWARVFFGFTFAAAASTIVSGAVAERAMLPAYMVFSSLTTALIYPVVSHWVWSSSGWLSVLNGDALLGGVIDFAGAGVVHMTGGVAALSGAWVIGPRVGRFDDQGHALPMPGHSSVLQVLGTFILWLGWYGFNAGSTLAINASAAEIAGRLVITTTLSASIGGIVAVNVDRFVKRGKDWDVSAMCNGILSGLVSITAGCAVVEPWAAVIIGACGACVYRLASKLVLAGRVDDPLDAFAVHGACGCWSILATAFFATPQYTHAVAPLNHGEDEGGVFNGDGRLVGAAAVFLAAHIAWVGSLSLSLFVALKRLGLLRVPNKYESAAFVGSTDGFGTVGRVGATNTANSDDGSVHAGKPMGVEITSGWAPAAAPPLKVSA